MLNRQPDFSNNILKVLKGERPERATLFELFLSSRQIRRLSQIPRPGDTPVDYMRMTISAMAYAGYDYATCYGSDLRFEKERIEQKDTRSLNGSSTIYDWESFEKYNWPDMRDQDYSRLEKIAPYLPEGMKLMVMGPNGVLENVIGIVGYDNLCFMLYEEPELAKEIFDNVGSRLVEYYDNAASFDTVGMISSNDDWGFNTQTFLSPDMMREYLFPWHKRIVEVAHKHGKPVLLHSCGNYTEVIDDVISDMHYDARHSYEDNIIPVEDAYESLNGRIAVLGGIDIHFLTTSSPEEIERRCRSMLERTWDRGGYALGSGNSIANYIPVENYMAMLRAAHEFNG
jgi:uroporphyrinogen decarboxylase